MRNSQGFGLEIIVNGKALLEYQYAGKTYVAAPWNSDFQLRFIVPRRVGFRFPSKRFMGVASVDGLDILTGKRANPNARGYCFTPASTLDDNDIPGFRLNREEVAAFHFGDRSDSYAARMDRPENVGVISVIYFSEHDPAPRLVSYGGNFKGGATFGGYGEHNTRSSGGTCGGDAMKGGGHDMGTEFGSRVEHKVGTTEFDKDVEIVRFTIEYASRESLTQAGIISIPSSPLGVVNPFDEIGGCRPPSNWHG